MPYLKRGDLATGEGFLICLAWAIGWVAFLSIIADVTGDDGGAQDLCLTFLLDDPIGCEPEAG